MRKRGCPHRHAAALARSFAAYSLAAWRRGAAGSRRRPAATGIYLPASTTGPVTSDRRSPNSIGARAAILSRDGSVRATCHRPPDREEPLRSPEARERAAAEAQARRRVRLRQNLVARYRNQAATARRAKPTAEATVRIIAIRTTDEP